MKIAVLSILVGLNTVAAAPLRLARIFGDNLVLQSGQPVPVWGWAEPNVKVNVSFAGQTKTALADPAGSWMVHLDPLASSSEPRELTVASDQTLRLSNVLVGEVWLASGQSNMEKPLGERAGQKPVINYQEELRAADWPQLRLLKIKRSREERPVQDLRAAAWEVCTPATLARTEFSAAAYFFGRKLQAELGVPIGLIDASWGSTRIELWTPPAGFATVPALAEFAEAAHRPGTVVERVVPGAVYNAMIHPLAPFGLRGAIWYQGESNIVDGDDGAGYADKMTALIKGWRQVWGRPLSFYYVQLAPYLYHVDRPNTVVSAESAPRLQEAQSAVMRLPATGMVVTTDLADDLFDIHPRNKRDVGERLARWALANDYERNDVPFCGPVFDRMEVQDSRALVFFTHTEGGLAARDGAALTWFVISGADGRFFPAEAASAGDHVVVTSPHVAAPRVVRFGWDEAARPNLINRAGLPAVPFRTDGPFRK